MAAKLLQIAQNTKYIWIFFIIWTKIRNFVA